MASAGIQPVERMTRSIFRWAPYAVPLIYLTVVFWLQPATHLGRTSGAPEWHFLLWDDYDWGAVALRAVNAELGRVPGVMVDPCRTVEGRTIHGTNGGTEPAPASYFLEYPDSALSLFRIPYHLFLHGEDRHIGPGILDVCQDPIVYHYPTTEEERALWRYFRQAVRCFEAASIICLLAFIVILRSGYRPRGSLYVPVYLLLLPSALYFTLNRFDIIPALMTALSLWCLGRNRIAASAVLLGTGAMIKVFPVLIAPLFLRYLFENRRRMMLWGTVFAVTLVVLFLPTLLRPGLQASLAPYRYQLSRELEFYSIYGSVLPTALGTRNWSWLRSAIVLCTIGALVWNRIPSLMSLLRRSAVVLVTFVILQVFFSPQWILWLAPFLIPIAGARRMLIPIIVILDLVLYLNFPILYNRDNLLHMGWFLKPAVVYVRFACAAATIWLLLRWDREESTALVREGFATV